MNVKYVKQIIATVDQNTDADQSVHRANPQIVRVSAIRPCIAQAAPELLSSKNTYASVKSRPWQNATGIHASCAQRPQRLIGLGVVPALLSLLCLCDFILVLYFKLIGIHGRLKELNYQEYIALVQH